MQWNLAKIGSLGLWALHFWGSSFVKKSWKQMHERARNIYKYLMVIESVVKKTRRPTFSQFPTNSIIEGQIICYLSKAFLQENVPLRLWLNLKSPSLMWRKWLGPYYLYPLTNFDLKMLTLIFLLPRLSVISVTL